MDLHLLGQVIIVTGGSRGIGKETVLQLISEGAKVATCSRHYEDLVLLKDFLNEKQKEQLLIYKCDIQDNEEVRAFVDTTVATFGKLDGIVANAGQGSSVKLLDSTKFDWISQYENKIACATNTVNAAIPYLKRSNTPRIVIINGITAIKPNLNMAAVSAARAALRQLSMMYAKELVDYGICVNSINLGVIDTSRQMEKYKKSGSIKSYSEWSYEEAIRRDIPFKRFGKVTEVAPIVLFLLSPLSSYITGSEVNIAGGINL